jgi:hypothetical protein
MIGIVLGSGLGPLADAVVLEREVSFADAGLRATSGRAGAAVGASRASRSSEGYRRDRNLTSFSINGIEGSTRQWAIGARPADAPETHGSLTENWKAGKLSP